MIDEEFLPLFRRRARELAAFAEQAVSAGVQVTRVTPHRLTPPGGQQVGKTTCAVRMEHITSGITVIVGCERSQHKNRLVAEDAILGALTSPYYTGES